MEASDAPGRRPRSASAPPALGTSNFHKARRIVIKCTMGQGVIGNLGRVVLMSDQFSSCSPVILFNAQTGMGGLFHFAAQNWEEGQPEALQAMYQAIRPTVIYLCDRTVASDLLFIGLKKSTDHIAQKKFFREHCGFTGKIKMLTLKSERYYVTLGADGSVNISAASQAAHIDVSSDEWTWVKAPPLSDVTTGYATKGVAKFGRNLW